MPHVPGIVGSAPWYSVLFRTLNKIQRDLLHFILKGEKVIWLQIRQVGFTYIDFMKHGKILPFKTLPVKQANEFPITVLIEHLRSR